MALTALTSGAQMLGVNETNNANASARDAQIAANAKASNAAAKEQYYQLDQRTMQEREAMSAKLQDIQRQRLQKTGQAMASSQGDLGLLMNDFYRQESLYKQNVTANFDMSALNNASQKQSVSEQNTARNASVTAYVPASNNLVGAGLQIAGAGIKGYVDDQSALRSSALKTVRW